MGDVQMKILTRGSIAVALVALAATSIGGSALAGGGGSITKTYTGGSFAIPESGGQVPPYSKVNVNQGGKIKDVDVKLRGADDSIGSVQMTLLPPSGPDIQVFDITAVNVASDIGSGPANCQGQKVTLNDSADEKLVEQDGDLSGQLKPAAKLSKLNGKSAKGNWRLVSNKVTPNDGGAVFCWQLKIKTK